MALGAESAWSSSTIQAFSIERDHVNTVIPTERSEWRNLLLGFCNAYETESESQGTKWRRDCVSLGFLPILTSLRDRTHCVRASNDMPLACR
jgi:hypothetical protein